MEVHQNDCEPWKVTLLDTGLNTMTGGRIKRAKKYIQNETFLLTYGDGLADVNIADLMKFHQLQGKKITMTAVQPEGRYGALSIGDQNVISSFVEKPKGEGLWINGGFFICDPSVLSEIDGDTTVFEKQPLSRLADSNQLVAYKHTGFWQCMDTLRDKTLLTQLWDNQTAPWKSSWDK